ncbi:MAG: polysaccharide deacetylase family protein [Solirubrobacteraceae bacterium]|jgi:peptidoglycan/xylan/chitin deacetylase (PgdA/CDA1 family)
MLRVPAAEVLLAATRSPPAAQAPTLILMYHRVDEDVNDPFSLVVHPRRFREHLRRLVGRADIIPLSELLPLRAGDRPRVAITFDDGYVDNLDLALPELELASVPATFFAISDLLGTREECWWDQLEQIFRAGWEGTRAISLTLRGETLTAEVSCDVRWLMEIHTHLLALTQAEIMPLIAELREQLHAPTVALERRIMTEDELRRLDASSCVEVGAHTRTHPKLPSLSATDQAAELSGARQRLEEVLGRPVHTLSYPFGAFDEDTLNAAQGSGYTHACTTEPACVSSSHSPLRLPRLGVENWDGYEFDLRVNHCLAAAA